MSTTANFQVAHNRLGGMMLAGLALTGRAVWPVSLV